MLSLPEGLQEKLRGPVASLCWCWKLTRADGLVIGLTDHDRTLVFEGVVFEPDGVAQPPDSEIEAGLSSGRAGLGLVLDHAAITQADLLAGVWEKTRVELYRVDWADTHDRVRTDIWWFGPAVLEDGFCQVELLGREAALERQIGRVFSRTCDARLGDSRCGVSASHPQFELGCDRSFAQCRARFANSTRFRELPKKSPASRPALSKLRRRLPPKIPKQLKMWPIKKLPPPRKLPKPKLFLRKK